MTSSLQHGHGGGQTVTPMQFHAAAQCALQGAASSMQQSSWVPANSSLSQLEASSWTKDQVIQRHDRTSPTNHKNNMHSTRHHVEQQNSSYRPESACSSDDLHQLADHALDQDFRQFAPSLENQQSDLLVEVADINFNLHKWRLSSRSALIRRLLASSHDLDHIKLEDMPGGAQAFELAANFCYGITLEFNSANIAALRCAAHYLEMSEELEPGNLASKAEAFLSSVILSSWQDSITALQCCETLHPWADKIHLTTRLVESIASKAACIAADPQAWSCSEPRPIMSSMNSYSSTPCTPRTSFRNDQQLDSAWWFQDVASLSIGYFIKVLTAMESKGSLKPQLLGAALEVYAHKWLPGFTIKVQAAASTDLSSSKDHISAATTEQDKNRETLQALVRMLPPHEKDDHAVSCSFVLGLLRAASMLNVGAEYKRELEKRAAMHLEQGVTLSELLIPSFSHTSEHLYDVDLVRRILEHYLAQLQQQAAAAPKLMKVAKLVESYLAEVARDKKLPVSKFQALAEALPEFMRISDDGLYRAIDTYLKAHPGLTEHERKKLCRVLDCQRLSIDACMHAAQNDRLPLRTVVQVLFSEQVKLRDAITGITNQVVKETELHTSSRLEAQGNNSTATGLQTGTQQVEASAAQEQVNQKDIKALQRDLDAMTVKCTQLEKEYTGIHEQVERLLKPPKPHSSSPWSSGWKKLSRMQIFHHHNKEETVMVPPPQRATPRKWRNSIS
ncbi:unnamed protein product [Sphagnum troendelagicum]